MNNLEESNCYHTTTPNHITWALNTILSINISWSAFKYFFVSLKESPAFNEEPASANNSQKEPWEYFDDDAYAMQEPIGSDPESDSDFEYEGGRVRKGRSKKGAAGGGSGKNRTVSFKQ